MSRKCPSCKKWLASGQFTCKCGYGEARLTPEEDIQFGRIQRELDQTHIETPGQNRWFYRAPTPEALELQGARVRAAEDFVLGDERRAKALGNSASLLSQAVRANSVAMLRALLPHCTEGVHNMRDSRGLSPLSVAIDMVREECFGLLLEMLPVELCDLKFVLPKQNRSALQHLSDQRYYHSTFGFQEHDPQAGAKLAEACERMLQLAYGKLGLSEEFQVLCARSSCSQPSAVLFPKGVQGAAVRAQRAAATQQVATPPLFPRSVWVILVHFCAPRERDVVLPCVCRFFRNLAPPDIRVLRIFDAVMALNPLEVNANAKVHRKRLESMMRFLAQDRDGTLNPAMVFGLGRQSGSFYHRYTELLKQATRRRERTFVTDALLSAGGPRFPSSLKRLSCDRGSRKRASH